MEPTATPTPQPERETIVVKKIIEVIEEEEEVQKVTAEEQVADDGNRTLLIVVPSAIVGILVIVAIIMAVRVYFNKKSQKHPLPLEAVAQVKTDVIEIEPQFVLEADDTKNIFARPSNAPFNADAIE